MRCDRSHRFEKKICYSPSEFEKSRMCDWFRIWAQELNGYEKPHPEPLGTIQRPVWLPSTSPLFSQLGRRLCILIPQPLHSTYLTAFTLRIKQGVLWFPLGELFRGLRSCSPPSTAAWDTKRACVLCQGTWWHFWASESLWISALESGFLEAASQTGSASGTLSHARPSICRRSIGSLWRGPCSQPGICSMFNSKKYHSKRSARRATDESFISNVCRAFVTMVTSRRRRDSERSEGEQRGCTLQLCWTEPEEPA